jgi:hypothetical protein
MNLPMRSITEIGKTIRDAVNSTPKTIRLIFIVAVIILMTSVGCAIQSGYQTVTVTVTRHQ